MDLLQHINPLYAVSGLAVGFLVGMTGVGGGSLMTPLLVLVFRIHPATAVGTDLLYAAATKTVGTGVHGWKRTVQWSIVARLAIGSVPASAVTLYFLSQQAKHGASGGALITVTLAWALIVTAIAILFRTAIVGFFAKRAKPISPGATTAFTILLGLVLGVLVSLTSVGSGALGMTVLLILYPKMEVAKLVGSDVAHAVPLTLLAGIGHWMMGDVNWQLLVSLLCGSIPGIIGGSLLAARTPDGVLRPILAGTLTLVGVKMLAG
ncbi:MAG TPA: sulfite exporter TauE/SafE family protein [Caulobacteraceae bacterium]|nr:sulfite exporter TauE/SafE family protein [Caulobacteraceae bacterium]